MQSTYKINGVLEFQLKSLFQSLIFFIYQVDNRFSFSKFNFDAKDHFSHFSFLFFVLEEREGHQILTLREKFLVVDDYDQKNSQFLCPWVPFHQWSFPWCFFFFSFLREARFDRGFGLNLIFKVYCGHGLSRCLGYYLGVLSQQQIENGF